MIIELNSAFQIGIPPQPGEVLERAAQFYERVDNDEGHDRVTQTYYKAALQASNDRINRIRRGVVMFNILINKPSEEIIIALNEMGLWTLAQAASGSAANIERGAALGGETRRLHRLQERRQARC